MDRDELTARTKQFALRCIRLCNALPNSPLGRTIKGQLLRAGTSVGANYRAASRARSRADFVNKLGIVEEEADESMYWMELIIEAGLMDKKKVDGLYKEANEIIAIVVASIKTSRPGRRK